MIGFVATASPEQAKQFYGERLGLALVEETPFAIVFESGNTVIRVQITKQVQPPPYTSLGWEVGNIAETASALSDTGMQFEQFEGLKQDTLGVWNSPDGSKVAWFRDPDGNLLSLTQSA